MKKRFAGLALIILLGVSIAGCDLGKSISQAQSDTANLPSLANGHIHPHELPANCDYNEKMIAVCH